MPFLYRTRVSFPGQSRGLVETGRLMAEVAADLAELLAPELHWKTKIAEHSDWGDPSEWEASHVVHLVGRDDAGVERGRGESRLVAGGKGSRIGGSGRIVLDALGPVRHLRLDNQCDITHWDVLAGPLDPAQRKALVATLQQHVGADPTLSGAREEPLDAAARTLADAPTDDDARLWADDLASASLEGAMRTDGDGAQAFVLTGATLPDIDALEDARVTLGEILSEAGRDDWDERARLALLSLGTPDAGG